MAKDINNSFPALGELKENYSQPYLIPGAKREIYDFLKNPYRLEKVVILSSSGLDGEFFTLDDLFVRVESVVVSNELNDLIESVSTYKPYYVREIDYAKDALEKGEDVVAYREYRGDMRVDHLKGRQEVVGRTRDERGQ